MPNAWQALAPVIISCDKHFPHFIVEEFFPSVLITCELHFQTHISNLPTPKGHQLGLKPHNLLSRLQHKTFCWSLYCHICCLTIHPYQSRLCVSLQGMHQIRSLPCLKSAAFHFQYDQAQTKLTKPLGSGPCHSFRPNPHKPLSHILDSCYRELLWLLWRCMLSLAVSLTQSAAPVSTSFLTHPNPFYLDDLL